MLAQPVRKQQFHSQLENSWLGRWLNANAPKGFGKFYRKPGEKPSGQPNSSGGSGAKDSKGTGSSSSNNEKMNMKGNMNQKKNTSGGAGRKPDNNDAVRLTLALASTVILLYILNGDELSNQK